jgi:hypothetical protein
MDPGSLATFRRGAVGDGWRSPRLALVALCGITAMLILWGPRAQAAGESLHLSPSSGAPGDTVIASGSGWLPGGGPVMVFVNLSESNDPANALMVQDPDSFGNFKGPLIVPIRKTATYRFLACQACGDPDPYPYDYSSFKITPPVEDPLLSITPSIGSPGETVGAAGSGWLQSKGTVMIFADRSEISSPEKSLASVEPGADGVFVTSFPVPDREPADHLFIACQDCGNGAYPLDIAPFTITAVQFVKPQLSLTPARGAPGETVTASGSGWIPEGGQIRVFANRSAMSDPASALATANPNADGVFSTPLRVPLKEPATYRFVACQACGEPHQLAARAVFTIKPVNSSLHPQLSLAPARGSQGETVTASGSGWLPARGPVRVFAHRSDIADPASALVVVKVSDKGTFATSLRVPQQRPGDYQFFACQACGDPAGYPADRAPFTIAVSNPRLTLTPASAKPGETVNASGSDWLPTGGPIRVFANRSDIRVPERALLVVEPDDVGSFSATLSVPSQDAADYTFYACQACGEPEGFPSATAAFTITAPRHIGLLILGLVLAALVAVAAGTAIQRYRLALRRPKFKPRADISFDVESSTPDGHGLPSLRLVPHDDSAIADRVEVRQ